MFLRKTTFIQMAENQMLTRGQWFDNGGSEAHTRGRGGAIWGEQVGKRKGGVRRTLSPRFRLKSHRRQSCCRAVRTLSAAPARNTARQHPHHKGPGAGALCGPGTVCGRQRPPR